MSAGVTSATGMSTNVDLPGPGTAPQVIGCSRKAGQQSSHLWRRQVRQGADMSPRYDSQILPAPPGGGAEDNEGSLLVGYVPTRRNFTAPGTSVRRAQPFGTLRDEQTIPGPKVALQPEKHESTPTFRVRSGTREPQHRICRPAGVSRQLMTYDKPPGSLASDLSDREREVMELLARGCSTAEIGRRLFISKSTVRSHISAIVHKLPAKDRTSAVALLRANNGDAQSPS